MNNEKKPHPLENTVFHGETYEPKYDKKRLTGQMKRIYDLMIDGEWRTLSDIENVVNAPQASISAALRTLRREENGGYQVNRRSRGDRHKGLFEYQVLLPTKNKLA